jgi:hypothetical protein
MLAKKKVAEREAHSGESPPDDKLVRLNALVEKIHQHRSELDDYLAEYAKLITPPGVPTVNIRMMIDAKGGCICQSSLFAINDQVVALELERRQRDGTV